MFMSHYSGSCLAEYLEESKSIKYEAERERDLPLVCNTSSKYPVHRTPATDGRYRGNSRA